MSKKDIRWVQRLSNFNMAFIRLEDAVRQAKDRKLSDLEEQGLIKAFEFTHELAWNVMKDYFEYQGIAGITGSRDAIREAFNTGLIEDGQTWMDTIKSRNETAHTYNQEVAEEISENIIYKYFEIFSAFREKMEEIRSGEQGGIF